MGLIAAAVGAVGGGLADQWLEVIEAGDMGEGVVLAKGVAVRTDKRNTNKKVPAILFQTVLLFM